MDRVDLRQNQLDVLRGIAILGIALMNVFGFAIPSWYSFDIYWQQTPVSTLDVWLYQIQQLLLQGRFRTLLTLLLGVGLWLLAKPFSNSIPHDIDQQLKRRYWALALFGFCHISFFWTGDITLWYALSALLLLAFGLLSWPALQQFRLGLSFIVITVLLNYAVAWSTLLSEPLPTQGLSEEDILVAQQLYHGPLLAWWQAMWQENLYGVLGFCFNLAWLNIGTMLIGIALYRQGFFQNGMTRWQEFILFTLACGLDVVGLYISEGQQSGMHFWYDFSALLMALVFASWIIKWRSQALIARMLQACGKMALSLYFLQTLLFLAWFNMLAPEWYANSERWQLLLLALAVMVLCGVFALTWQRFYATGPLESVWRRLYQLKAPSQVV